MRRTIGSRADGIAEKSGQIRSLKKWSCRSSTTGSTEETVSVWPFPESRPVAAAVVGEIGEPAGVVQVGMGQEHMPDLELLAEAQRRRDTPRLEEDRAVEQETGEVPRGRGPTLTAKNSELHGEHTSEEARQAALESRLGTVKDP
jgi:hypothetical protein